MAQLGSHRFSSVCLGLRRFRCVLCIQGVGVLFMSVYALHTSTYECIGVNYECIGVATMKGFLNCFGKYECIGVGELKV